MKLFKVNINESYHDYHVISTDHDTACKIAVLKFRQYCYLHNLICNIDFIEAIQVITTDGRPVTYAGYCHNKFQLLNNRYRHSRKIWSVVQINDDCVYAADVTDTMVVRKFRFNRQVTEVL